MLMRMRMRVWAEGVSDVEVELDFTIGAWALGTCVVQPEAMMIRGNEEEIIVPMNGAIHGDG